ncbi:MAG: hypothetical protein RLN72_11350 [Henriciella sp.]
MPHDVQAENNSGCDDHLGVSIVHADPAELDLACAALGDIVSFFQSIDFNIAPTGALQFADRAIDHTSEGFTAHGFFDAPQSRIVIFRTSNVSPWGQQWSSNLAGSFLRHELAHMAIWEVVNRNGVALRPEWHEFIAYAIQFDLMESDLRDLLFATRADARPFEDLLQVNEFISRMDPELFALAAYETYLVRGGKQFVGQLLRAEVVPPPFVYPFPVLPGQVPDQ